MAKSPIGFGQVAQLVERGPEKAGVGGSIPSLATSPSKMKNYLSLFWLVPAIALVVPVVAILIMAARVRGAIVGIAVDIYQVMFLFTPAVGVIVLLSLLALLIFQRALLRRFNVGATIVLAILNVISPVGFFLLGAILSGFTR